MNDKQISQAEAPVSATQQCRTNRSRRILVVDDDNFSRQINAGILINSGFLVGAAEDGEAGWEALQAINYDLVITDNNMPRLTGIELVKKLRSAHMALPVIMATGTLPPKEFVQNPQLKPAVILVKPFTPDELLKAVEDILRAMESAGILPKPWIRVPSLNERTPGGIWPK